MVFLREATLISGLPPQKVMEKGLHWTMAVCAAPLVDQHQSGRCWGRPTLDHVKCQLRMGKRAKSDIHHLVALCEGHTENGAKAGFQWNTANRPALREYIQTANHVFTLYVQGEK